MDIEKFCFKYETDLYYNTNEIYAKWDREKRLEELLNSPVAPGVVLADLLNNDQLLDQIKPELKEAFDKLSRNKAYTIEQIRRELYDKLEKGEESVNGLINKMIGQIGENEFLNEAKRNGIHARLAESGSQEGWDIVKENADGTREYIQVKLYDDPDRVLSSIKEISQKIEVGEIVDGDEIVHSIDFAVPADILDEVRERSLELGYDIDFYSLSISNEDARDLVEVGFGFSEYTEEAFENLFSDLFGSILTTAALHALANGFLLYKGAKNTEEFWHQTIENTAISSGAITAGMAVEIILTNIAKVGGIPTYALVLGTTIVTRQVLKRIANRQSYVDWLQVQINDLGALIVSFS